MPLQTPVSDAHHLALGRVTVNFALLEQMLRSLIGALISNSNDQTELRIGRIVTADMSFSSLVSLTAALYRHRYEDKTKLMALDGLIKEVRHAEDRRNQLIHSIWGAGHDEAVTRMKARARDTTKGYTFSSESLKAGAIEADAIKIADAAEAVQRFLLGLYSPA